MDSRDDEAEVDASKKTLRCAKLKETLKKYKIPLCVLFAAWMIFVIRAVCHRILTETDHYMYELQLHRCRQDSPLTIRALRPSNTDCIYENFAVSQLAQIRPELNKIWPSCYSTGKTDEQLWDEEWRSAGRCSKLSQFDYFSTALTLRNMYAHGCADNTPSCSVKVDDGFLSTNQALVAPSNFNEGLSRLEDFSFSYKCSLFKTVCDHIIQTAITKIGDCSTLGEKSVGVCKKYGSGWIADICAKTLPIIITKACTAALHKVGKWTPEDCVKAVGCSNSLLAYNQPHAQLLMAHQQVTKPLHFMGMDLGSDLRLKDELCNSEYLLFWGDKTEVHGTTFSVENYYTEMCEFGVAGFADNDAMESWYKNMEIDGDTTRGIGPGPNTTTLYSFDKNKEALEWWVQNTDEGVVKTANELGTQIINHLF